MDNMRDCGQQQEREKFNISIECDHDFNNGLCTFTVQDGLALPVKVRIPFVAVKASCIDIMTAEVQMTVARMRSIQPPI